MTANQCQEKNWNIGLLLYRSGSYAGYNMALEDDKKDQNRDDSQ